MPKKKEHPERREYIRIRKNFLLSYFELNNPEMKHDISQLKNISMGGICFVTSKEFPAETKLGIELNTPYLDGTTYIEGTILGSYERLPNALYETRLKFDTLNPDAESVLQKIVEFYQEGENKS